MTLQPIQGEVGKFTRIYPVRCLRPRFTGVTKSVSHELVKAHATSMHAKRPNLLIVELNSKFTKHLREIYSAP